MPGAVVFAYHDVGVRCLSALIDRGIPVGLVVTHRDDPRENVWFGSVERLARAHGLEVALPDDPNTPAFIDQVGRVRPEWLFSFYYRRMLSRDLLGTATRGAWNMHGSLLPKYRGRAPVNWAILHGERETGATLHEMVEKPDAGGIVDQMSVPILEDDTALDVFRKVTVAAELVMHRSLPAIAAGSVPARPQDLAAGSYFGRRRPEDGRIDWSRPAREIHDLVRAVAPPFPGAFCDVEGRRLNVNRTRKLPKSTAPGSPGVAHTATGLVARCGDGGELALLEWEWA